MKLKELTTGIMLLAVFLVVASLAVSCAAAKPQPKAVEPPPKSPALTYTISDETVIKLLISLIGDTQIRFLPGNKVHVRYAVTDIIVSIEARGGELCIEGMESVFYRYGAGRVDKYLKKRDDGKLHLVALWFDPRTELKADSDKLPYIESVTTREGQATFTYRWP